MENDTEKSLAPIERYALVPWNPTVVALSKALHWKPTTAIRRIERALPDKFEQQIYLTLAPSLGLQPETVAKLFTIYRQEIGENRPWNVQDLEQPWRPIGKNVVSNSLGHFTDFAVACLKLTKLVAQDYPAFTFGTVLAAHIVAAYGTNSPEQVIEMIDANLDECCEFFGVSPLHPYSHRMRTCIYLFINKLLPELQQRGVPNPLDPDEFMGTLQTKGTDEDEEVFSDLEFKSRLAELLNGDL